MRADIGGRAISVAAAVALLVLAALVIGGPRSADAGTQLTSAQRASAALVSGPALPTKDPAETAIAQRLKGQALLAVAGEVESTVPLPPGATFSDIDWQAIGSTSISGIRAFVEYNASCDWYRRWLTVRTIDEAATRDALSVITAIPNWPSFRTRESGMNAALIADAAASGDPEAASRQVTVNCG